jgi:hypothetical protein
MKRRQRIRLTYANVVATMAMFAALGGSSYAAISITGKQVRDASLSGRDIRNGSLTSRDVHDGALLARDFKVGQLPAGPPGAQGPRGLQGPKGDRGPAGTALAFARVFGSGGVDEARTQGAGLTDANVTHPAPGFYCFDNLPFTPRNAQITADFSANVLGEVLIGDSSACPGVEDVFVQWTRRSDGTSTSTGFYIVFN